MTPPFNENTARKPTAIEADEKRAFVQETASHLKSNGQKMGGTFEQQANDLPPSVRELGYEEPTESELRAEEIKENNKLRRDLDEGAARGGMGDVASNTLTTTAYQNMQGNQSKQERRQREEAATRAYIAILQNSIDNFQAYTDGLKERMGELLDEIHELSELIDRADDLIEAQENGEEIDINEVRQWLDDRGEPYDENASLEQLMAQIHEERAEVIKDLDTANQLYNDAANKLDQAEEAQKDTMTRLENGEITQEQAARKLSEDKAWIEGGNKDALGSEVRVDSVNEVFTENLGNAEANYDQFTFG